MTTTINLLSPQAVAELIGVRVETLATWRSTHRQGLPYIRIGRKIRYAEQAVLAWLASRTVDDGAGK